MARRTCLALLAAACLFSPPGLAQQAEPETIPFQGGTLTIAETDDSDKVLAFDGEELTGAYVLFHDRSLEVSGEKVELFQAGDGGNQCGTATVIVWKPAEGDIQTAIAGDDCGSPPPAVTEHSIYFVPYMLPGASEPVQVWTPDDGLRLAGTMAYAPQPGTGWADLDASDLYNIVDAFQNAAVYEAAQKLLGDAMTDFATGLLVGGGTQSLPSGAFHASGCVPHACGGANSFMAVDKARQALYFAQQGDGPTTLAWPPIDTWPADVRQAKEEAIGE